MSVQTELTRISTAKTNIKNVVNNNTANIITNQKLDAFPPLINGTIAAQKGYIPWIKGEGKYFTLKNSKFGELDKFEMYGNTEQTTYSGKNLLAYTSYGEEKQGITTTYDSEDGALILNGTASNTYSDLTKASSIDIATGTYTFSISEAKDYNIRLRIAYTDNTNLNATISKGSTSISVNITKAVSTQRIFIYENNTLSGTTFTNEKIYAQLESGSTATSFEPYVGGIASPNPDYPQDVRVVENEQNINVHGKNLNKTSIIVNLTSGSEKWIGTRLDEVKWENGKTYYIKAFLEKQSNESVQITNYGYKNIDNKRDKIVFNGNVPYVRVGANTLNTNVTNEEVKIMVSTETFTDFEPYQSKEYEIDLHGKNLIEGSNDFSGIWNNSQNWETDTNSYNNLIVKKKQGTWNGINKEIYITAGTYTFSLFAKSDSARTAYIYLGGTLTTDNLVPQAKQLNLTTEWQRYDVTFTSNANGTVKPRLENPIVISNNYTYICGYQLEENSTATDYEEFYDYKLCKIGDYKDSIKKSTGKNLFDGGWSNGSIGSNGQNIRDSKSIRTTGIGVKSGVQYTFSSSTTTSINEFWINYYNGDAFVSREYFSSGNIQTFIVPSGVNIARFRLTATTDINTNIINNVQLEQNSQATEYEPYGEQWYIKKEIGKVVLDTSNITLRSNYTNIEYAEITKPNDFIGKGNYDNYNVYCSHAISDIKNAVQYAWDSTYRIGKITNKATTGNLWLGFSKGTGLDNIKTALNGAVIYYVLATPIYETITNETLINQLEAIETFEGINNISIENENNVLPDLLMITKNKDSYNNWKTKEGLN